MEDSMTTTLGWLSLASVLPCCRCLQRVVLVAMAKTMPRSDMIVRRVKVDRSVTPQDLLISTTRDLYTDEKAVASMPRGEGEEVEVCFFPLKKSTSDAQVAQALAARGLTADPYAQVQANAEDAAFADSHPNGVSWQDKFGNWNFIVFRRFLVERYVNVDRRDHGLKGIRFAAGSRPIKLSKA